MLSLTDHSPLSLGFSFPYGQMLLVTDASGGFASDAFDDSLLTGKLAKPSALQAWWHMLATLSTRKLEAGLPQRQGLPGQLGDILPQN